MTPDVTRLVEFYRSPLGGLARALVRDEVARLAGPPARLRVLGLGFATPYLRFALGTAERVLALMPARQGAAIWPREGPSCAVLCDPLEMPLTDAAVDLVVAVHAFEHVADTEELMAELWRVMAPGGRLIAVVPRRRGMWAAADNQPFGMGHPFSRSQLERLLRNHSFEPEAWREALHFPPVTYRPLLRLARFMEGFGRLFGALFAGVIVVAAKKRLFPAVPRRPKAERLVRLPSLTPQVAMARLCFRPAPPLWFGTEPPSPITDR